MNCPKCKSEMETVKYESVEVDRCKGCKGIWFDEFEAGDLKGLKGAESIDTGDPSVGKEYNQIGDIHCPKCEAKMIKMVDNRQPHIWYEGCAACYGLFFDAGEFADYKEENFLDFFKDLLASGREAKAIDKSDLNGEDAGRILE